MLIFFGTWRRSGEPEILTLAFQIDVWKHSAVKFADDDRLPVMVPRSDKETRPTPAERTRQLRNHLVETLRALRRSRHPERLVSPVRPEPNGVAAQVASAACSLCKGYCCTGGGDDAYLDEWTMGRVRRARPELSALGVLRLYAGLVPAQIYDGSCIFHGRQGCTLSRALRSDVCNSYYCRGLGDYVRGGDAMTPVIIIAGERGQMRTARVPT